MSKRPSQPNGLAETLFPGLDPGVAPAAPPGSEGHRARLRARLLTAGPDSLHDYEMLEMLLHGALPRRDTKALAKALLNRHGSFANVITADQQDLLAAEGLGQAGVAILKVVDGAAKRLLRAEVLNRDVVDNWERLLDYLHAVMARERIEQFRVLFLDGRNRLLKDEQQARGTVNHTPVYPREVVKRALELKASALILVHNHPSGDPAPSTDDIAMTREVNAAATALGIRLHDHVIVGNKCWLSFKQQGLL